MTSVARRREQDDSGEFSDASQDIEQNNSGNDGSQQASDYDSPGSDSEHSDREEESQEGQTERRVDDDEDRSNPQYIPKRGTFYEHDDRTAASGEELSNTTTETASEKKEGSETPSERRRAPRKSESINKWSHDKYNENEQMPKSRDELVAIYGYDIRNEDAPPHARRNRRYGRGPNKYTRTWEDEEAYKRQTAAAAQHRKVPNAEDFPELDAKFNSRRARARPRSKSQPASNDSSESGSQLRRQASIKGKGKPARAAGRAAPTPGTGPETGTGTGPGKPGGKPAPVADKMPAIENLTITASAHNTSNGPQRKVSAAVAQQRPVPTEQPKRKPHPQPATAPSNNSKQQPSAAQPQQQQKGQQNQQTQQNATPNEPRGGSKRYSSLRQRPLAESYSPQTPQQKPQQQPQQPQQQQQQQQQQQPPQQSQQQQQQQPQQQQQQPQPPQPQPQQQQHRYHGEYVSGTPPAPHQGSPVQQIHPQQMMHQVHRNAGAGPPHGPSPPHGLPLLAPAVQPVQPVPLPPGHIDHSQQQVRLGIMEQQQIVSHQHQPHHGLHQTHSIGQLQPPQAYAPPAIMPTQYMQQQNASGSVYGGAMYQPPAAYPQQMYPHHNYQQATQAGGVTYYSCAEQEQQPRAQRRPTAAIPIVRPAAPVAGALPAPSPALLPALPAGPVAAAGPDRPANSTEKDNIDRIVENMFVRKPWPATHGVDSKDKPETQRSSQEPPSKESSQPNSLTSSSISTDSKPSEPREEERAAEGPQEPVVSA